MKNLTTAVLMTIVTTVLLGLIYPLAVTGLAQVIFPDNANGQLIKSADGTVIGSRLIGQPFSSPGYFRSRPSAAGATGYDARASSGSNLGPTTEGRQFGFLGEPRVNVLELNLDLDQKRPMKR